MSKLINDVIHNQYDITIKSIKSIKINCQLERKITMNEIITINYNNEQPTVLGRDLHEALEVKTEYKKWFERMTDYGFEENKDYVKVTQKCLTSTTGQNITNHQLTIPMAKELCMLQRSEKGKEFRKYFITVEEQWNTPEAVMARALQFANRQLESIKSQNIQLTETVTKLQNVNDVLAEKQLEWTDRISLNKLVRVGAGYLTCSFSMLWKMLYDELYNKHHISLVSRKSKSGDSKSSLIEYLRESEYPIAFSVLISLFKNFGLDDSRIDTILQKAKM